MSDANDESLRKWKESLGIGSGTSVSDPNDPRKVIILSLGLEVSVTFQGYSFRQCAQLPQVEGRPDIVIDLKEKGAVDKLKDKPFTIKEGETFRMKATFKVQHQVLAGLKYIQVAKRMGLSDKMQEMIVSF